MQNRSQNQKTSDEKHTGAFQTPSKALFLAAGTASGVLEASVFHPWDTIATRLQISKEKIDSALELELRKLDVIV